ncbi:Polypeptide N-acetylgalactosaminyltransferase 18 [Microtus ochrogaster]|uniref:Polypeptide N-acetylgalactosaminyltransferase 18 n=1 Tax=Microtus ochrogaster TaxID=79684 RepID=A0A8J6G204_MICOH|nr:Polypeptide N-acetylgalactosaminyltransferase 18 [Microtus ochrogaster]
MVCTRKTKTLVSTCVILSGMTNIICLLYVGWVTNYIASVYVRGQEPAPDKKLEEDKGDTLKIMERLDHLENVIKQHIQGCFFPGSQGHTLVQECDRLWMFVYPREYKGKRAHLATVRDRKDALRDPNCGL